jgi:hypothetical protein
MTLAFTLFMFLKKGAPFSGMKCKLDVTYICYAIDLEGLIPYPCGKDRRRPVVHVELRENYKVSIVCFLHNKVWKFYAITERPSSKNRKHFHFAKRS